MADALIMEKFLALARKKMVELEKVAGLIEIRTLFQEIVKNSQLIFSLISFFTLM